jgi:hypothetical protein
LNFWPIPTQQVTSCRIYSWQPLAAPSTYGTAIAFPPAYAEAFRYNLAVRLAAEYGKEPPAAVVAIASESLGRVKAMNAPEMDVRSDLVPVAGGYNYRADLFGMGF